ncbi:MAG: type IV secretion system DNA-binding domain-containing protein [Alphaproteobacteria bacterium]|nr:type IV secretion system DNA-binding domain-containing protein [Alphaproteobacteria bacterium]
MALDLKKHAVTSKTVRRDIRPLYVRFWEWLKKPSNALIIFLMGAMMPFFVPMTANLMDIVFLGYLFIFWCMKKTDRKLPAKMPMGAPYFDSKNTAAGRGGKAEGILYVGYDRTTSEQLWFTNADARTHILYLGTTGSGKTEGLKSFVTNALTWGSGYVYIDGKADTDLWSSLCALAMRFGRDDDLLVLNYMTGNSDARAPSNTMNPFSSGSASYLSNMLVSLMPDAEGDNAMWKERAVSLMNSLMPALTWKRDHQEMPLSVSTIRDYLNLSKIIELSRDRSIPEGLSASIKGYLDTLPGYVEAAFDDNGKEKPMGPDQPMVDTTTVRQQHGYLTMQFTRALQSLGDNYGYIFDAQAADVDMVDIVLNRRILIVLIPALEKSGDETANLGKIVAATIKGMMGLTLGATLEGESATVIENKPTHSATPFMTVFDEVGYYTAQGMAVMAAQARSLGFCLIFAAQDLQAMEKRVKEEARSITANCNIKIFGKLQDPTQTREFFENQMGKGYILKSTGYQLRGGMSSGSFFDNQQASVDLASRADYDDLKEMTEGQAIISFGLDVIQANIFYSNPGHAKAMRVTRYIALPPPDEHIIKNTAQITKLRDLLVHKTWTALGSDVKINTPPEIESLSEGYLTGVVRKRDPIECGIFALAELHAQKFPDEARAALDPPPASVPDPAPTPSMPTETSSVSPDMALAAPLAPPVTSSAWDTLVKETATSPISPQPYRKTTLTDDIATIVREAGENIHQVLFKKGERRE